MGTVPERPEEPTKEARAKTAARILIAGHEQGVVRRIVLYLVVAVALITAPALVAGVGLAALILLATTDQLA